MKTLDLTPFYRNSIGFDRLASMIDNAMTTENPQPGYPPYNIEMMDENAYAISIAVAGFTQDEIDISVEKGVLTVVGNKATKETGQYLYQGIANRNFQRKFNLADHIEVVGADLKNGLLTISLVREIPEAMKPKKIEINQSVQENRKITQDKQKSQNDKVA